jgi:hypothetical protein
VYDGMLAMAAVTPLALEPVDINARRGCKHPPHFEQRDKQLRAKLS